MVHEKGNTVAVNYILVQWSQYLVSRHSRQDILLFWEQSLIRFISTLVSWEAISITEEELIPEIPSGSPSFFWYLHRHTDVSPSNYVWVLSLSFVSSWSLFLFSTTVPFTARLPCILSTTRNFEMRMKQTLCPSFAWILVLQINREKLLQEFHVNHKTGLWGILVSSQTKKRPAHSAYHGRFQRWQQYGFSSTEPT